MSLDLNALSAVLAVARAGSFRAAAERLGVTRSAVSQAVRKQEDAVGVALFRRTTRSVALTEAGAALVTRIGPALDELAAAAGEAADRDARPSGLLRLAASSIAESFLSGEMLAAFGAAHPAVQVDVLVTDEEFDIVAGGFDAAVRLGEVIERDMVAVPASRPQRQIVVAAPSYLDRFGAPAHPRDLTAHRCVGWRPKPDASPYRWEFSEAGRDFDVAVEPEFTTNDMTLMIRLACAGAGLTVGLAETFDPWIGRGALRPVLDAFCPTFPGFFLFYPSRRNMAPKLRAFVDHVRSWRPAAASA